MVRIGIPVNDAVLDQVAERIGAGATIAGLGESTRFAHETFAVREQLFRRLVRNHGFRALAVQDDTRVAEALDTFVTGGAGTAAAALDGAWRPWRTEEMAAALDWIRAFNHDHPDRPVRILGVKPAQARPADYDTVLEHVRATAPGQLAALAARLEPIRTAHQIDEHVQRARGIHPGGSFAEHARAALAIVEHLPDQGVLPLMRRIADFHERSVAGRNDYAGDARTWAATIVGHQRRTGARIAYWDGIAHTAATPVTLGLAPERGAQPTVGAVLREEYGAGYVAVAIGFHHGDLGIADVPAPAPDWLDARLGTADQPALWLDLRTPGDRRRWNAPATVRVISGIYDPTRDAAEHLTVDNLPAAVDVLVHLREVSPVRRLP
ncbi:erythromycin esterase family protein [Dactylosporangium siamense]|uniref:Succinoglycan biosynthesis n=1 Tax=Dactylosporangium siamense TaxID=685454 RepID=A0A919UCS9_9ACTN|nr:erythromycin esterase family protein [Dactylosporangium siamense]GIG47141.1 succinoglycan biosynthesis [Dactylosporangium siamense]